MTVAERKQPLAVPGWDRPERRRVGVLEPRPLDARVEVPRVDEERAALVRCRRDCPHQRGSARLGDDPDDLARLHVCTDLDDQAGVTVQERVFHG